jgi:hypothetical protein
MELEAASRVKNNSNGDRYTKPRKTTPKGVGRVFITIGSAEETTVYSRDNRAA